MPAKPRWLLSIPDAISQLEQLDRTLLTRRDVERLFGVSKARAATLMQTFGAEMTGNQRTLPRTKLLQQLNKHRGRGAFRGEEERRARLVAELQKARLTGVRFKVPAETMSAQLAAAYIRTVGPPGIGPDREAAPGRDPYARRLARRQPSPPGEPRRGRARSEARRHQGRDAGPLASGGEEAPRDDRHGRLGRGEGSGTGRCSR